MTAPRGDDEAAPEGDAVCWVDRVCEECGGIEDGPPSPECPRCSAPREES